MTKKFNPWIESLLKLVKSFFKKDIWSFLIFFSFGYFLGLVSAHQKFFNVLNSALDRTWNGLEGLAHPYWNLLKGIKPNVEFLSDAAAFESVVVALAIPLSYEIVSKISDRYKSESIMRSFEKELVIRVLPIFLISNIVLLVCARFLTNASSDSTAWKIWAWILLVFFIIGAILLYSFTRSIKKYLGGTSVVKKFLEDAHDAVEK